MQGSLVLLLGQHSEEGPALQNHTVEVKIEAQREVGVGSPQMQADQAADGSIHLGGISLGLMVAQQHGVKVKKRCWLVLEAKDG